MSADPVIQALDAVSRTLLDLAARVVPPGEGEWDAPRYRPGGDRYVSRFQLIYRTPVLPTTYIPFDDPEEDAARERAEGARMALAVLREAGAPPSAHRGRVRRLKAEPWPGRRGGRYADPR